MCHEFMCLFGADWFSLVVSSIRDTRKNLLCVIPLCVFLVPMGLGWLYHRFGIRGKFPDVP